MPNTKSPHHLSKKALCISSKKNAGTVKHLLLDGFNVAISAKPNFVAKRNVVEAAC